MTKSFKYNRFTVYTKICTSCGREFQPTNNRTYECYDCVPKEHRNFNQKLKGNYGETFGYLAYMEMLENQQWKCKICGKDLQIRNTSNYHDSAVVDHCHKTNKVRGILCRTCNLGLGYLKDDPDLALKMAQYLKETGRMVRAEPVEIGNQDINEEF